VIQHKKIPTTQTTTGVSEQKMTFDFNLGKPSFYIIIMQSFLSKLEQSQT